MGAAVVAATFNVHLGNGVGDRSYVVAGTQDLRNSYKLGIGELTLDLRDVRFTSAGDARQGSRRHRRPAT